MHHENPLRLPPENSRNPPPLEKRGGANFCLIFAKQVLFFICKSDLPIESSSVKFKFKNQIRDVIFKVEPRVNRLLRRASSQRR